MSVIRVENLNKSIKRKVILEDLSFTVERGDCLALIGPNGAGKTSLMNCLLGDMKTTSGIIEVEGKAPGHPQLKASVSYLPQENAIVQKLTVQELINFFRSIYPNPLTGEEIDDLLRFSSEQKKQLASKLSGGQKRLLSFVLTLIGRPSLLFLDEPTAGMDTSTRQRFWEIVGHLKEEGVTIVYSSHYIEEVEHTADRILVLHQGHLLRDTTPLAMRSEEVEKHFTLPLRYQALAAEMEGVSEVIIKPDALQIVTRDANRLWTRLQEEGCSIQEIEVSNRSLLDSIFENTKEVGREDETHESSRRG